MHGAHVILVHPYYKLSSHASFCTVSRSPIERVFSFCTLASSSLLLFHGLLTSLPPASNPVKSLACYSDTFLLTLLLQLSLNSSFLLSAQSLNTGVSSGTLLLLPSLNPLTLSNTALKIAAKFRPSLIPSIYIILLQSSFPYLQSPNG